MAHALKSAGQRLAKVAAFSTVATELPSRRPAADGYEQLLERSDRLRLARRITSDLADQTRWLSGQRLDAEDAVHQMACLRRHHLALNVHVLLADPDEEVRGIFGAVYPNELFRLECVNAELSSRIRVSDLGENAHERFRLNRLL